MSNSITIKGTVHHIGQTEEVGSKGFTKRLLVVHNGEQYDPTVPIEFKKDKCALLDSLRVGQTVTVSINLGGREYQGRYFPSLTGWKIEASAPPHSVSAPPQSVSAPPAEEDTELPF
jgi:single-strand DNA-binding protein